MKKFAILIAIILTIPFVLAIPPIATEFYGMVFNHDGSNATAPVVVEGFDIYLWESERFPPLLSNIRKVVDVFCKDILPVSTNLRELTDKVAVPRKSTLSRPSLSSTCISNCVTARIGLSSRVPLVGRCSGMYSVMGLSVMITPAACVPALRATPSRREAVSINSRM